MLADGTPDSASVAVEWATNTAFADPAVAIARRMRFTPARVAGCDVPVWFRVPVIFTPPTPPGEGNYELSPVEREPQLRNAAHAARQIARHYPRAQRERAVSGDVLVRLRVLVDGTVDSASVVAVTDTAFELPALAVSRQLHFTPGLVGGRPVMVWMMFPIHFGVEGNGRRRRFRAQTSAPVSRSECGRHDSALGEVP
jgi:TonB family protein